MGIRDSLSRLKERFDPKPKGRRHKLDDTGSGTDGEGVGPARSLPRPVPYVAVGGIHGGGGGGSNADGSEVHSRGQVPRPGETDPAPSDRERGEECISGGDEKCLHPRPDVEVVVGSRPAREGGGIDGGETEQVYPSPSMPSIPYSGEADGM